MSRLSGYLSDPLLKGMYDLVRESGPVRPISLDITSKCNLRCTGCYYYAEGMDKVPADSDDVVFDQMLALEQTRGTNFVTVVGGEPALVPDRLRKIYRQFKMNVATNGVIPIPREGLEDMPLGIAVWGDHATDAGLRNKGKDDLFSVALDNYRDDPRAFFYYTVAPGHAHEIESVVEQSINNGNRVLFNYYSDVSELGGDLDYRRGFDQVSRQVEKMIDRYPDMLFTTRYLNQVVTTGRLDGKAWGYDVCTNLTADNPVNAGRIQNGNPYNRHFRAINADFQSTRRCCTGMDRDCDSCFDTWEHFSWVMINMRKHLHSKQAFTDWLSTMFSFYVVNRLVDYETGLEYLRQVQSDDAFSYP
ncbi:MAG: radical SAM protein [Xanthomonadales bacterium]|nr:radical SAM protein [Xanthomonadales bacterium]